MTGDEQAPEMKSFNDYLTAILPICFGVLNMTAQEICDSTPWEIAQRIKGYEERQRRKRVFIASFLTLPIINSGFCRPKKGVDLKDIIPEDLQQGEATQGEIQHWRQVLSEARNRGKKWQTLKKL